jgi:hypothetical protein
MKKIERIKKGLCFHCRQKRHKASECEKKKRVDEETAEQDTMHVHQQLLWMK